MSNSSINFIEEFAKDGGALPEQRLVKRSILDSRREAKEKLTEFSGHKKEAKEVKNALYSYYVDIISHTDEELVASSLMSKIEEIRPYLYDNGYNLGQIEKNIWSNIFEIIDRVGKEIGILKITRNKEKMNIGYEIFNGLGWQPPLRWKNWGRTKLNLRNLAKNMLTEDGNQDAFGIIWGTKGWGKSTLSLHIMKELKDIVNCKKITRENFVIKLEDMQRVKKEKISPYQIDELTNVLDARRAISTENVVVSDIIRKMRHRNLFGLGCTVELKDVDTNAINYADFAIKLIERGKFKFYTKEQLEKFEKKQGEWKIPKENWIGHFPPLKGELWKRYENEIEEEKDKSKKEREKEKEEEKNKRSAHCNRCGYDWTPRKENIEDIKKCPECQSPYWNDENENSSQQQ